MIENAKELAAAAKNVAGNYKTIYARGCFGWPMNEKNRERAMGSYAYNRKAERAEVIRKATEDTFAFDCVCFIKALLWGWNGDPSKNYGGAVYCSNQVPDLNADQMFAKCTDVSGNFTEIQIGEAVWQKGHIGVYIGDGLAVECTPAWSDGVQITAVGNIGTIKGYNSRKWTSHGKLPYVRYEESDFSLSMHKIFNGITGEQVRALQYMLTARGFRCGSSGVDGIFGEQTKKALISYQKKHGLAADGIAGYETYASILGVRE